VSTVRTVRTVSSVDDVIEDEASKSQNRSHSESKSRRCGSLDTTFYPYIYDHLLYRGSPLFRNDVIEIEISKSRGAGYNK
jgi:hypothetical protein